MSSVGTYVFGLDVGM